MIQLIQFPGSFGLPNGSPFCLRVETFLKLADLPYEVQEEANPRNSPKGKLPVIDDNGHVIADSSFIVDHLTQAHGVALDDGMTPQQKAVAHAYTRMLTENFYWVIAHGRFLHPEGIPVMKENFTGDMPPIIGPLFYSMIRSGLVKQLNGHGMGRHKHAEVAAIGRADLDALETLLGDQPYFFGEEPTSFDATAFAFLANIAYVPIATEVRAALLKKPNLVQYCERMKQRCFPEKMTATLPES